METGYLTLEQEQVSGLFMVIHRQVHTIDVVVTKTMYLQQQTYACCSYAKYIVFFYFLGRR